MVSFGFQLYSARDVPSLEAFLPRLSAYGYQHVEGFGPVYADATAMRAALDAAGLAMPSGHFGLDMLRDDFEGCIATANTLGLKTIVAPYLDPNDRPIDAAGYVALARRLSLLQDRCADAGLRFAWHNHDFEFTPLADGAVGMEILLTEAPKMLWEADLAWIVRAGADPVEWVTRYGDRVAIVHVKDTAAPEENPEQEGWADLGHGIVDWPKLISAVRSTGPADVLWIAEHDAPPDPHGFATRAIATFGTWMG